MKAPPRRPTAEDFRAAPRGAYVCEEGWLVIGQEAWTLHEWRHFSGKRPKHVGIGRPPKYRTEAKHAKHARRYGCDEERREARRRSKRESMRRRRAGL